MRELPFNLQEKRVLEVADISSIPSVSRKNRKKEGTFLSCEPTSVLDRRRSPSPPTSELQPIPTCLEIIRDGLAGTEKYGLGIEDWESMLFESTASPIQEQSLFRWIMGDIEGPPGQDFEGNAEFRFADPGFHFESAGEDFPAPGTVMCNISSGFPPNSKINDNLFPNSKAPCFGSSSSSNNPSKPLFSGSPENLSLPFSLPSGMFFQQQVSEEKPQIFNISQALVHQQQQGHHLLLPNPPFFSPESAIVEPNQISKIPFDDDDHEHFPQRQQMGFPHQLQLHQQIPTMESKPKIPATGDEMTFRNQQQAFIDQLLKAAEMMETGNLVLARGILARLNHQLSSPVGIKSLHRAVFYFKEALQLVLMNSSPQRNSTSIDIVLKIGAYKAFSEISPLLQFTNFTGNQALLEALEGCDRIHIIDFDIGFGGQWASLIQELAVRNNGTKLLKIIAFNSSTSSHDPFEVSLTKENLKLFANEVGITFEIEFMNLDNFDPAIFNISQNDTVAINLPASSSSNHPLLLRFVKQLSPKIVISVERSCDRNDLSFSHHVIHALQSYTILLDSLESVNLESDSVQKIERYLFQPNIENIILRRHRAMEKMTPWKTLLASSGFYPLKISNFSETQAACLVKRFQVRGFHVEKRQASLVLFWQRRELVSVSAWRC